MQIFNSVLPHFDLYIEPRQCGFIFKENSFYNFRILLLLNFLPAAYTGCQYDKEYPNIYRIYIN